RDRKFRSPRIRKASEEVSRLRSGDRTERSCCRRRDAPTRGTVAVSDVEGLLAAIRADPEDDAPRLVFADWLEEDDQPERAELIRVQCEAARLPEGDKERRAKEKRAKALLGAHKHVWFGPLPKRFTCKEIHWCRIDRGFVADLCGPAEDVLKYAEDID